MEKWKTREAAHGYHHLFIHLFLFFACPIWIFSHQKAKKDAWWIYFTNWIIMALLVHLIGHHHHHYNISFSVVTDGTDWGIGKGERRNERGREREEEKTGSPVEKRKPT